VTSSSDQDERLFDLIYDAAADQEIWPSVLAHIADRTRSMGGFILGVEIKNEKFGPLLFNARMSEEAHHINIERHFVNPWSSHMIKVPAGSVVRSDEIIPLPELKRTAFFDEVLRPQSMGHNAMSALAKKKDFVAAFNICRTMRQGPFGHDEIRLLESLVPHLQRSLVLGFRVDAYRKLQRAEYDVLDRLSMGIILLGRQERIVYVNAAANSYDAEGSLSLRNLSVSTPVAAHNRRLANLIQAALRGTPASSVSLPHAAAA
jgi:hypothetical protein